jgi:hypothetical protein
LPTDCRILKNIVIFVLTQRQQYIGIPISHRSGIHGIGKEHPTKKEGTGLGQLVQGLFQAHD